MEEIGEITVEWHFSDFGVVILFLDTTCTVASGTALRNLSRLEPRMSMPLGEN
jgi:hypothetical protein